MFLGTSVTFCQKCFRIVRILSKKTSHIVSGTFLGQPWYSRDIIDIMNLMISIFIPISNITRSIVLNYCELRKSERTPPIFFWIGPPIAPSYYTSSTHLSSQNQIDIRNRCSIFLYEEYIASKIATKFFQWQEIDWSMKPHSWLYIF